MVAVTKVTVLSSFPLGQVDPTHTCRCRFPGRPLGHSSSPLRHCTWPQYLPFRHLPRQGSCLYLSPCSAGPWPPLAPAERGHLINAVDSYRVDCQGPGPSDAPLPAPREEGEQEQLGGWASCPLPAPGRPPGAQSSGQTMGFHAGWTLTLCMEDSLQPQQGLEKAACDHSGPAGLAGGPSGTEEEGGSHGRLTCQVACSQVQLQSTAPREGSAVS